MHEAGIADRILEAVVARATAAGARRVTAVFVEAGDASGVSEESLAFHWPEHARGTIADGAQLVMTRVDDPGAFRLVALDVEEGDRR